MWIVLTLVLFQQPSEAARPDPTEAILAAARKGDVAGVKKLLDQGADVNAKGRYDVTPLMTAALRGNVELVRLLLERGADTGIKDSFYKASPLGMALSSSPPHYEVAELLAAKGSDGVGDALSTGIEDDRLSLVRAALSSGKVPKDALSGALLQAKRGRKSEAVALLTAAGAVLPPTLPAEVLNRYVGTYRGDGTTELTVTVEDGVLVAKFAGPQPPIPLASIDQTSFRPADSDGVRLGFTLDNGVGKTLTVEGPRGKQVYTRVEKP